VPVTGCGAVHTIPFGLTRALAKSEGSLAGFDRQYLEPAEPVEWSASWPFICFCANRPTRVVCALSAREKLRIDYEHKKRVSKFNGQRICNGRLHQPSTADLVSARR
jgi:hypothetical protein